MVFGEILQLGLLAFQVIQAVVLCVAVVWSYQARRHRVNEKELQGIAVRLSVAEATLGALPQAAAFAELADDVGKVEGEVKAISASLKLIVPQVTLIHEHLLNSRRAV